MDGEPADEADVSEVGTAVLVDEGVEARREVGLLAEGPDREEAGEGGREERVDVRTGEGVVADGVHRLGEGELPDESSKEEKRKEKHCH